MRIFLAALTALVVAACAAGPVGNSNVPEPAKRVDIGRYGGLWYEFARYENGFERDCEAVTAEYTLLASGDVSVKNTCREDSVRGPIKVSEGKARPAGDQLGAKFKVSFFGPALLTNYWVLDRGENYDWAIVGEGSGRFLWLLTREPRPSEEMRAQLLARVEALGYDTDMLRYTQHMATP
ncbi:lipocalin [Phenylobacterium sp. Root77]|jgi:apolipoprotein D and lipocalin family protein|uniref:lipocalin family protein n=1 Tax=unclassified Phenylobacterium TaxID=2640670 RepID=UPI0006FABCA1|nr:MULTISPECIES: lipocalin family protein [unclassified Phenylobacterium]KQW69085.1 lipocalin [Phenylobacterium sp. Root1277]KQW95548.1 lipocalin [Phenylobacterium sp. Root1290]KRC41337.1 lipocalin [Phenylobacterium sp. Root77]